MNYFRAAKNWGFVASRTAGYGSVALAVDLFADRVYAARRASQWCMYKWAGSCADGLGIRRTLVAPERLTQAPQCVIVSNHLSLLDILVLGGFLDRDYRWVAKESVFRVPVLGRHLQMAGHIPVYRKEPQLNRALPQRIHEAVGQGASILFFPEGTRSADGRLKPFKVGAFRTAVDEALPILPVVIRGTERLLRKGTLDLAIETSREVEVEVLPLVAPPPPDHGETKVRAELLKDEVHGQFSRLLGNG
jgi:1-acyl-sn-glycerol-3-phosphate acyltransferase